MMVVSARSSLRLVVDTNVFVAAGFRPSSRSAAVLRAIRDGDARLVWDDATRSETKAVLERLTARITTHLSLSRGGASDVEIRSPRSSIFM